MKKSSKSQPARMQNEPIAIVGMSCQFPEAEDLFEFWSNISKKKSSIQDIESVNKRSYWAKEDFYDPNPQAQDKTYSYQAGFIKPINFDPIAFKIPPLLIESISTAQLFALHVARKAVIDAGLDQDQSAVNKDKIGVILGGAGNGNTSFALLIRQQIPTYQKVARNCGIPEPIVEEMGKRLYDSSLEWNEDSFPGFLGNVACGRIASCFDFGGTSNMVDAACASSHAAIKAAIQELRSGSCDAILTGGVNLENSIFSFMCFSKTPALSKSGISRPFDQDADGMLLGDGVGMLVLKRLSDAKTHGDKIYAVIKGIEASSDGRAKSVFAPRDVGQVKALEKTYLATGISPDEIELIEAHGTGTASGDDTELSSLSTVYSNYKIPEKSIALGSVKSQIGHTRCAAGAASLIKVALALHHKVLPPTINVTNPAPIFQNKNSPFYVNSEARPWIRRDEKKPRRAATSAFGFGGTNFHILVEEYQKEHQEPYRTRKLPEVVTFSESTPELLLSQLQQIQSLWCANSEKDFAQHIRVQTIQVPGSFARLCMTAMDTKEVLDQLQKVIPLIQKNPTQGFDHPLGIFYQPKSVINSPSEIAMVFPGQGSQYVNMAKEVANNFPELRESLRKANQVSALNKAPLISSIIYPFPKFTDAEVELDHKILTLTENAPPALAAISAGYKNLLDHLGLKAGKYAGHSFGELTALWAAGGINEEQFYRLAYGRGRAMQHALSAEDDTGCMAAIAAPEDHVLEVISQYESLTIANCNSPNQTVIAGSQNHINQAIQIFEQQNIKGQMLNVSAAFHSKYVESGKEYFEKVLIAEKIKTPTAALYSNVTGLLHEQQVAKIKHNLAEQLIKPVRFVKMIKSLYQDGSRLFIEVGPKGVLGKLVNDILAGQSHQVVSFNPSSKGDHSSQLFTALAKLIALGVQLNSVDPYRLRAEPTEQKSKIQIRLDGGNFLSQKRLNYTEHALTADHQVFQRFLQPIMDKKIENERSQYIQQEKSLQDHILSLEKKLKQYEIQHKKVLDENASLFRQVEKLTEALNKKEKIVEVIPPLKQVSQGVHMSNFHDKTSDAIIEQLDLQKQVNEVHSQFQSNQMEYLKMLDSLFERQHRLLEQYENNPRFDQVIQHLNQSVSLLEKNQAMYHVNHEQYFQSQIMMTTSQGESSTLIPSVQAVSAQAQSDLNQATVDVQAQTAVIETVNQQQTAMYQDAKKPQTSNTAVKANTSTEQKQMSQVPQAAPVQHAAVVAPSFNMNAQVVANEKPQVDTAPVTSKNTVDATKTTTDVTTNFSAEVMVKLKSLTEDDLCKQLIDLVSQKTGYPTDMIELDMDLEADLGIDSIKRIEIFSVLFEKLLGSDDRQNLEVEDIEMDSAAFDVDEFSTVRKIAAATLKAIQEMIQAPAAATVQSIKAEEKNNLMAESSEPAPEQAHSDETIRNRTMQMGFLASTSDSYEKSAMEGAAVKKPQPQTRAAVNQSGVLRLQSELKQRAKADQQQFGLAENQLWVIAESNQGEAELVLKLMQNQHQNTVIVSLDEQANSRAYHLKSANDSEIIELLNQIEANTDKKIGGFVYAETAQATSSIQQSLCGQSRKVLKKIFMLAKHLQPRLFEAAKSKSAYFIASIRNDGLLGTSGQTQMTLTCAGLTGLIKSLSYEWPQVFCRYIDIAKSVSVEKFIRLLSQELADPDRNVNEVACCEQGKRYAKQLTVTDTSVYSHDLSISQDQVFLVTGGARGITASCIEKLAQLKPAIFILLGRTELTNLPDWFEGEITENNLKKQALVYLKQTGAKPTPVTVKRLIQPYLKQNEIRNNIARIASTGAKVEYLAVDIQNQQALKKQIHLVEQRLGEITGIIHGAGNLADKKIDKKTLSDFETVFSAKIDGLSHVIESINVNALRHLVLFSSVSGFFGNAGQTDYSIANEVLSSFANQFQHQYPNCFVRALNWGPWDGGMVDANLKKAYQARKMVLIPLDVGVQYFVDEFKTNTNMSSQLIIGGKAYRADVKATDLLKEPKVISRELDLDQNPMVRDHKLGHHCILPAAFAVEWMLAEVFAYFPGYYLDELFSFEVLKGITFRKNCESYQVSLTRCESSVDKKPVIKAIISSWNDGKQFFHYRAGIRLSTKQAKFAKKKLKDITAVVELPLPLYHNQQRGYLFHGESLQGLEVVAEDTESSMIVVCQLSQFKESGQFNWSRFLNAAIVDVCIQVGYLWGRVHYQQVRLPLAIQSLKHYEPIHFDQPFVVNLKVISQNKHHFKAEMFICGLDGQLLLEMKDVQYTKVDSMTKQENKFLIESKETELA